MKRVGGLIIVGIIILIPVLIAFYWQSKEFKYTELPVYSTDELGEKGKLEMIKLASTLMEIEKSLPIDIDWILQIDGHTDNLSVKQGQSYRDNWELSTRRALSVLRFCIPSCFLYFGKKTKPPARIMKIKARILYLKAKNFATFFLTILYELLF